MARTSALRSSTPLRIGVVAVAAVIVAELAVWILKPRADVPEPLPVEGSDYFSAGQLERAEDFADGQRALFVTTLVVEGAVLVVLALWRPAPLRRRLLRASSRPVLGAAAVGAAISLTVAIVGLPTAVVAHERARDVGLATQTIGPWLGDAGKQSAVSAALAAAGAALAVWLMRRMGRRWWLGGAASVVAFAAVFSSLAPVVLAPLFNRFEKLPPGPVRSEVVRLGERAGVDIGEVYRVDASRRSSGLNAYVTGLGPTKRVVLYDNLLRREDPEVIGSVVAHELGHVRADDILRGLAFVAIVAPLGALLVQLSTTALARRSGEQPATPGVLPALALSLAAVSFVLAVPGNQLSRRVEARADAFALELTGDPRTFIELQQRLAVTNVADPDPPEPLRFLLGSHPTTLERIGAALAFRAEQATRRETRGGS